MSRRRFRNRVIVVRVRKPRPAARQPRETTVELPPESVDIIVSKLVNRDENDERRRAGRAVICFARELGIGPAAAQYAKEEQNRFQRLPHSQIIPR